ncbi:hypothetical protein BC829DRAFT_390702, partial [Chytridium lagenaria]
MTEKRSHDVDEPAAKGFDWKPFIPSLVLGQTRRRLTAAVPDTFTNKIACAAVAGAAQAAVALALGAPSALEKRPEEAALVAYSKKNFVKALILTMLRNAAGFTVFFTIYDAVKAKPENVKKAAFKLLKTSSPPFFLCWLSTHHGPLTENFPRMWVRVESKVETLTREPSTDLRPVLQSFYFYGSHGYLFGEDGMV